MGACTEEPWPPFRDNQFMRKAAVFALALALGVALAVAAIVGTISRRDRDGLPVADLFQVEPVPNDPTSPIDDQLQYMLEILGGERQFTEADVASRFAPEFTEQFPADELNQLIGADLAAHGTISFVRVWDRQPQTVDQPEGVRVLGAAENGTPMEIVLFLGDDDRVVGLNYAPVDQSELRRVPAWESALILVAGSVLLAGAAAAWRYRAAAEAWTLWAASIATLAGLLILSDARAAYTVGRALPSLVVVFGVVLLAGPNAGRRGRWVMMVAVAAAAVAALAPFVRDSSLVGHPTVVGAIADSETAYRALFTTSAGLTLLAMVGAVALNIGRMREASAQMRSAPQFAVAIATVWGLAAAGSALDFATTDAVVANGPLRVVTLAALALLGAVVILRLFVTRWDRVELAALVVDLESRAGDL